VFEELPPAPVIYQADEDEEVEEEEEDEGGLLPAAIVFPVQLAAVAWKLAIISLIGQPIQLLIWLYILIDWVVDLAVRITLGWFCAPCAWLVIWAFKLPTFPIIFLGWFFRILVESMGLLVDGWMLFFGGSGCYLRWGHDCWFAKRFKDRRYYEIADLVIFLRNPSDFFVKDPTLSFSDTVHQFFNVPRVEDFHTDFAKLIGEKRRNQLADTCPINRFNVADAKHKIDEALQFFSL